MLVFFSDTLGRVQNVINRALMCLDSLKTDKKKLTREVPDSNFPNPSGASFMNSNPAGARAGFENQHKTTSEPE